MNISLAHAVVDLAAASLFTCALLDNGHMQCWGNGGNGQLGYVEDTATLTLSLFFAPILAGVVNVSTTKQVTTIATGAFDTCAALSDGTVSCWGAGIYGGLGYDPQSPSGNQYAPRAGSVGDLSAARLWRRQCVRLATLCGTTRIAMAFKTPARPASPT